MTATDHSTVQAGRGDLAHADEVARGARFEFGANWRRFLDVLDEERIAEAEISLRTMLEVGDLRGKSFLDVGSGSGLFSLAARRLGARVHSFDYDPQSVACTMELRRRYFPGDGSWVVESGSVLDAAYLGTLGAYDVVYSWGVLHHTGQMWTALDRVVPLVSPGGTLFIAIYNDQGRASQLWTRVKRLYCELPRPLKPLVLWPAAVRLWAPTLVRDTLRGRPLHTWRSYAGSRGMSPWRDVVDWVGGYPFEVATPDQIRDFYVERGFTPRTVRAVTGLGCNEFVLQRSAASR